MTRRWFSLGAALCVPVFISCVVVGCGGETPPERRKVTGPSTRGNEVSNTAKEAPSELASTGWGKLTGKIVFDGTPPPFRIIPEMLKSSDKNACLAGGKREQQDQTWLVGPDKGVADAVIWVEPPPPKYFKIRDDLKKPADVVMDQPHCAFMPHVVALFPKYQDKAGYKSTGQQLKVKNDSQLSHNFAVSARSINANIPKGEARLFTFPPSEDPYRAECSVHGWMSAYIWSFDHPYFAVSKDNGTFELIVPAEVEISVRGWHQSRPNWFPPEKITVKDGETKDLGDILIR